MAAVRLCVANLLRRRVAGVVVVAVLVGIGAGAVLSAFAGARRTESAYPRLLGEINTLDVLVSPDFGEVVPARDLARLPQVAMAVDAYGFGLSQWSGRGAKPDPPPLGDLNTLGVSGAASRAGIELPQLRAGRLPRDDRVAEVFLNDAAAEAFKVGVGSTLHWSLYDFGELFDDTGALDPDATFTPVTLRVVGTGRTVDDLLANENADLAFMGVTPAFVERYRDRASYRVAGVFLDRGLADLDAFVADLDRALGDQAVQLQSRDARERAFAEVSEPYTTALNLFALAAALAVLVVVGQALVRMVDLDAIDSPAWFALGARRRARTGIAVGRALVALGAGAVLSVLVAVALSPRFPLGRARLAEPDPGVRVDGLVLGVGSVVLVVVLTVPVVWAAWRVVRTREAFDGPATRPPSRIADGLARAGAPAPMVTGVRFALRDSGGRRVPMVTTLTGLVVATATLVAALTFASSLDRMITTPALYGWTWDALTDTADSGASESLVDAVIDDDRIAGLTIGTRGHVTLDGAPVPAYGFEKVRRDASPTAGRGRMPVRPDELALGATTMRRLGAHVGGEIVATAADGDRVRYTVVGRTALPSLALNETGGLGDGAAFTTDGLARLDPTASPSFFLVDLAPGATLREVRQTYGPMNAATLGPQRPGAILTYGDVRRTPLFLAALLAVLGAGVLVHLLVTSVRARRHELGILKAIGCTRRQLGATVAVQATTLVLVALVVGVPAGLAVGRLTWTRFADDIGVAAGVAIPVGAVLAFVLGALVVANVAAAVPARSAARTRAAVVLRSE